MTQPPKGPVLFDLEEDAPEPVREAPRRAAPKAKPAEPELTPATAPPVPDLGPPPPTGQAMQTIARLGARPVSSIAKLFWWALAALLSLLVSLAAWDFVAGLLARSPILGSIATALIALVLLTLLVLALRELIAFGRLRRLDTLQKDAAAALVSGDLEQARGVVTKLLAVYKGREDLSWGHDRLTRKQGEAFEADTLISMAEAELLSPLDLAAQEEVEAAARQVATVTAIVPLALADVVAALTANLRMIRRIAEVYGGRSGVLGNWRLTRSVLTHLVATGAVAIGDDMIGSVAGGGVLSKLSRRFGEGIVNGALTARVGVAAMEVCRPLPFGKGKRPSVTGLVKRALTGLFGA